MSRFIRKGRAAAPKDTVPQADAILLSKAGPVPRSLLEVAETLGKTWTSASVEVATYTVQNWGARHENEDRVMTAPGRHGELCFHTIGILDGHDSDLASDYVARHLPRLLAERMRAGTPVEDAYVAAMEDCETGLKKHCATAGSCVLGCTIAGENIWCANLGDCRAAMISLRVPEVPDEPSKATRLVWLSKDQKACVPEEIKRIHAAGGRVLNGRVEGLEPSRTLGDFDVKAQVPAGVISIVPEVRFQSLGKDEGPIQAILVCATDGVWDVITGQDICDLIHARAELASLQYAKLESPEGRVELSPLRDLAEDLVQFAVARGSRDDCTAVTALISVC